MINLRRTYYNWMRFGLFVRSNIRMFRIRMKTAVVCENTYILFVWFFLVLSVFFSPFSKLVRVGVSHTSKSNTRFAFTFTPDIIHIQIVTNTTEGINNICTGWTISAAEDQTSPWGEDVVLKSPGTAPSLLVRVLSLRWSWRRRV